MEKINNNLLKINAFILKKKILQNSECIGEQVA